MSRRLLTLILGLALVAVSHAQPPGYSFIQQLGKPCRLRSDDLPWQVFNPSGRYPEVLDHVLNSYNREAKLLGLPPFFERTTVPEAANLVVDWSGRGLPPDKAGAVFWDANLGYKRVLGLAMDGQHRVPPGNRAQILLQEFGHVLGLGDSTVSTDVMHPVMHKRRYYRLQQARLTERDQAALRWLYQTSDWVPILGLKQKLKRTPPQPAPLFTPISK